jgi:hypothetical protein
MTYYVYCIVSTFLVVLCSPLAQHIFMFAIESDSIHIVHSIGSSRSPQLGSLLHHSCTPWRDYMYLHLQQAC